MRPGLMRSSCFTLSAVKFLLLTVMLSLAAGCGLRSESRGVPAEVEAVIAAVTDDLAAERYEKIYNEAADLWKAGVDFGRDCQRLQDVAREAW